MQNQVAPYTLPVFEKPRSLASPAEQIPVGKLVELSGRRYSARFTTAVSIVLQAQREGETVAWVQSKGGALFPPDLDESGVDLNSLVVIHIGSAAGFHGIPKAAEILLRSGGFGMVVLDFSDSALPKTDRRHASASRQTPWQGRLFALAREHKSRVLCLTDTEISEASLGTLCGLRIAPQRIRQRQGLFSIEQRILKNKSGIELRMRKEQKRAPWGLW